MTADPTLRRFAEYCRDYCVGRRSINPTWEDLATMFNQWAAQPDRAAGDGAPLSQSSGYIWGPQTCQACFDAGVARGRRDEREENGSFHEGATHQKDAIIAMLEDQEYPSSLIDKVRCVCVGLARQRSEGGA